MDKEDFIRQLNKKLEKERYIELAKLYFDESSEEEQAVLNISHLADFLQIHCEIKYD